MVSRSLKAVVVMATIFAVVAYLLHTPFPDGFRRPYLASTMGAFARVFPALGGLLADVGIGDKFNNTRTLITTFLKWDYVETNTVAITEEEMDGVKVLLFKPRSKVKGLRPGMVFVHGGGWVLLDPESYAPVLKYMAEQTQAVIMSPDYRLAPEHTFPIPLDDTVAATKYFIRNAKQYGVDNNRIGIAGDSAGGNLAMATALKLSKLKDKDLPQLKYLGLMYPCLQAFDFDLPSHVIHRDGPGLVRKSTIVTYFLYYLFGEISLYDAFMANQHTSPALKKSIHGSYVNPELLPDFIKKDMTLPPRDDFGNETLSKEVGHLITDPMFSPLMASDKDLSLLPPTYVLIAEYDVLRDEGFIVASRLENAGIKTVVDYYAHEDHGFLNWVPIDDVAKRAVEKFADFAIESC